FVTPLSCASVLVFCSSCGSLRCLLSFPTRRSSDLLSLLLLGPGTSVTHAAIATMAEAGCLVAWVGEQAVRFYAQGLGETRSSANLLRQARLWAYPDELMRIVRRMYEMRFQDPIPADLTLLSVR